MGVMSDGSYGIDPGIIYSHPVTVSPQGHVSIYKGLEISNYSRAMMDKTKEELLQESVQALDIIRL